MSLNIRTIFRKESWHPRRMALLAWGQVKRMHSLKYIVVVVVAVAVVGFIDENSVWSHVTNKRRIAVLEDEIRQHLDTHRRNMEQLHELNTDPKAVEKIARERYFMKTSDEDIFVLSDDIASDNNDEEPDNDGGKQ